MAENTLIEWADHTANLWMGCTKISPACDNCYAELLCTTRMGVEWGPHADRRKVKAGMQLIGRLQRAAAKNGGVDPKLGRKARVFVNSLSDFFDNHKSIDPEWRTEFYRAAEQSADVILMLVTKRPENVRKMVPPSWLEPGGWPAHVWLMVTAEDQERARHRVTLLLDLPVPVRCVSAEPLLGWIDFEEVWHGESALDPECWGECGWCPAGLPPLHNCQQGRQSEAAALKGRSGIDWIIVGGESGVNARDHDFLENARGILAQCQAAGVPFFGKQNVRKAPLPDDLMVREFPA